MALSAIGFLFGFFGRPTQIVILRCFNSCALNPGPGSTRTVAALCKGSWWSRSLRRPFFMHYFLLLLTKVAAVMKVTYSRVTNMSWRSLLRMSAAKCVPMPAGGSEVDWGIRAFGTSFRDCQVWQPFVVASTASFKFIYDREKFICLWMFHLNV